ncbi:hypothetical protein H8E88_34870 [candidate division KSB1 bacterium]|nr:hypothetical protein [candidate division KSB1 bacterium]
MSEKSPIINEWKKLFELMIKIKEIAPWEWLYEQDIFAVQNPKTNELGFVSVMGANGEHYAISVYLGETGLHRFWDLQQIPIDVFAQQELIEMPHLQAVLEDRDLLDAKDRDLIKKTGFKFRGTHSWPMFRSHRPGFFPWYLEPDEMFFLQCALDQTIDVAPRVKQDLSLLKPNDKQNYLLRKQVRKNDKFIWQDSILKVTSSPQIKLDCPQNKNAIKILKTTAPNAAASEIDLFMISKPVKEKGKRPFFPYALMILDADNGMIIENKLLQPLPTLEALWGNIPYQVAEIFAKIQLRPKKILVSNELLYQLLIRFTYDLNISLKRIDVLPNISLAREAMVEFFKQQGGL